MDIIAYNLRRIRKENKRTQDEVAKALNIKRNTYATYEDNIALPQVVAVAFCKYFKVQLKELSKPIPDGLELLESNQGNARIIDLGDVQVMRVPVFPYRAQAGYFTGYGDSEYIETLPTYPWIVDKEYKGKYMTFEVQNDSMSDGSVESYEPGDKVLGREIQRHLWESKLHIRKWQDFVIVHKVEGVLIKRITNHNTATGIITAHSLNTEYPDREISLNDVLQLFNVVQLSRKK